jgi:hypothetical protein
VSRVTVTDRQWGHAIFTHPSMKPPGYNPKWDWTPVGWVVTYTPWTETSMIWRNPTTWVVLVDVLVLAELCYWALR